MTRPRNAKPRGGNRGCVPHGRWLGTRHRLSVVCDPCSWRTHPLAASDGRLHQLKRRPHPGTNPHVGVYP